MFRWSRDGEVWRLGVVWSRGRLWHGCAALLWRSYPWQPGRKQTVLSAWPPCLPSRNRRLPRWICCAKNETSVKAIALHTLLWYRRWLWWMKTNWPRKQIVTFQFSKHHEYCHKSCSIVFNMQSQISLCWHCAIFIKFSRSDLHLRRTHENISFVHNIDKYNKASWVGSKTYPVKRC